MNKSFKVSVVFPSYNESMNIKEAIQRVSKCLGKNLFEIIVVDDNSPDKTWKVVQDMKNPKYKVIRRMKERGLASALADGVNAAKGNIVVWLDCDMGVPPEIIIKLVDQLENYDVAIASRYVGIGKDKRPFFRGFASIMINLFAQLVLSFKIKDYTSGVIAVKKKVTDKIKLSRKGFGEYFVEFVYDCLKNNFKITEVGYVYTNRLKGVSKSDGSIFDLLRYGFQYGFKILSLRFK